MCNSIERTFSLEVFLGRPPVVTGVQEVVVGEDGGVGVAQEEDAAAAKVSLHDRRKKTFLLMRKNEGAAV